MKPVGLSAQTNVTITVSFVCFFLLSVMLRMKKSRRMPQHTTTGGLLILRRGNTIRQSRILPESLELNPAFASGYISRGFAYCQKGEYDRAIDDYTRAIEIEPGAGKDLQ